MKQLTILFLVILPFFSKAQKIKEGTYYTAKKDRGFVSEVFQFQEDHTFRYLLSSCTGMRFGKGTYAIEKTDLLVLAFEDCETCDQFVDLESSYEQSDSLTINIIINDDLGDRIPGTNAFVLDSGVGTMSDMDGRIAMKIPKANTSRILRIQSVGYDRLDIPLAPGLTKMEGNVLLSFLSIYEKGDIKTFKIKGSKPDKIRLSSRNSDRISYVRIDPEELKGIFSYRSNEYINHFMNE